MLRILSRSLLASQSSQSRAGIFTSSKCFQNEDIPESESEPMGRHHEKSINSVTLLGRVGIEPQIRGSETHPVVVFSLATNFSFKKGESYQSTTSWHNIAVFKPSLRMTVEQHVSKGHRVMVQGRILYGTVEDKMGQKRHTTTIVADDVIMISS